MSTDKNPPEIEIINNYKAMEKQGYNSGFNIILKHTH
jgi:hypothetical protein